VFDGLYIKYLSYLHGKIHGFYQKDIAGANGIVHLVLPVRATAGKMVARISPSGELLVS